MFGHDGDSSLVSEMKGVSSCFGKRWKRQNNVRINKLDLETTRKKIEDKFNCTPNSQNTVWETYYLKSKHLIFHAFSTLIVLSAQQTPNKERLQGLYNFLFDMEREIS